MQTQTKSFIEKYKIIAIVRDIGKEKIADVAKALYDGGINLIEVTFCQTAPESHSDTTAGIKAIHDALGGKVCVGAGTVMTPRQVKEAVDAGAKYIISPNLDKEIINETKRLGALSIPGAATPSEAAQAYKDGADFVKIFPAAPLGIPYLKALRAPMGHIPLLAVGGIDENNIDGFLAAGISGVGVGSSLVDVNLIEKEKWAELTQLASKFAGKR